MPDEEEGEGESAERPVDAPADGGSSPRGIKRKFKPAKSHSQSKAVKAEPQSLSGRSSMGQSDVIDLT